VATLYFYFSFLHIFKVQRFAAPLISRRGFTAILQTIGSPLLIRPRIPPALLVYIPRPAVAEYDGVVHFTSFHNSTFEPRSYLNAFYCALYSLIHEQVRRWLIEHGLAPHRQGRRYPNISTIPPTLSPFASCCVDHGSHLHSRLRVVASYRVFFSVFPDVLHTRWFCTNASEFHNMTEDFNPVHSEDFLCNGASGDPSDRFGADDRPPPSSREPVF